ncbi:hypothetical protein [Streptomyces sp. CRN 30]|uniref:hypothetical protein n=1 Tax=Streptomyces sp. CRN 30 TaxID=3075613 RepID=UPI002A81A1B1|nr:hypothetical protein [Streptomyces sp. CRN 30]
MVWNQLLSVVFATLLDLLLHSRPAAVSLACLALIAVGMRMRSSACVSVGALIFLLLMAQA